MFLVECGKQEEASLDELKEVVGEAAAKKIVGHGKE
jgi:hypothetical protein